MIGVSRWRSHRIHVQVYRLIIRQPPSDGIAVHIQPSANQPISHPVQPPLDSVAVQSSLAAIQPSSPAHQPASPRRHSRPSARPAASPAPPYSPSQPSPPPPTRGYVGGTLRVPPVFDQILPEFDDRPKKRTPRVPPPYFKFFQSLTIARDIGDPPGHIPRQTSIKFDIGGTVGVVTIAFP